VLLFIDDILVYSKNEEEHKEYLRLVLQNFREHQLYEKFSKFEFYKDKIQYMVYFISNEAFSVDPENVRAILSSPITKDVSHVLSYMGITRYYNRFIEVFWKRAYPITSLQKEWTKFEWTTKY